MWWCWYHDDDVMMPNIGGDHHDDDHQVIQVIRADPRPRDLSVRVTVAGSLGSGKSALVVRFLTRRFIGEYHHQCEYSINSMNCAGNNYFVKPHCTTSLLTSEITGYLWKFSTRTKLWLILCRARSSWWCSPSRTGRLYSAPGVFWTKWSGQTGTGCCCSVTNWTWTIWEK